MSDNLKNTLAEGAEQAAGAPEAVSCPLQFGRRTRPGF